MSENDIAVFENIFITLNNKAYHWDLWVAAYTIHSGCSDDSFADFRARLITLGDWSMKKQHVQPTVLPISELKR